MLIVPWKGSDHHVALPGNRLSSHVPAQIPSFPPGKLCYSVDFSFDSGVPKMGFISGHHWRVLDILFSSRLDSLLWILLPVEFPGCCAWLSWVAAVF